MTVFPKITLPIANPLLRVHGFVHPVPGPPIGPPPLPIAGTNPGKVTKLLAWYRPSTLSAVDGSEIATWIDSAGNHYDANAMDTTGHRPTVQRNAIKGNSAALVGVFRRGLQYVSPFYPSSASTVVPRLTEISTWTVYAVLKWHANSGFVFFMGDGSTYGVRLGLTGGKFRITLCDIGDYDSNETVSLDTWHYIVARSNAGVQSVWVDGVRLTGYSGTHGTNYQPGVLGVADAAGTFDGTLAELAYYDKAVGAHGRQKLFNYSRITYGL